MAEPAATSPATDGRKLSFLQQFLYALGNFGVAFSPTIVGAWLLHYYCGGEDESGQATGYLSPAVFSAIWFVTYWLNGPTDPLVGYLSDRTRSRWGRRKPWILIGAPFLALSFFFLWTPATPTPSLANAAILSVALFFFWFFFTVVVAPYLALLPEITPYDGERVRISTFMGIMEVVGTAAGNVLPPVLATVLASGFLFLTDGYQVTGLIGAACLLGFFLLSIATAKETYVVPERPAGESGTTAGRALKEFLSVFKNPAFPPYVIAAGFYRMAIATVAAVTPFIATKILASFPTGDSERAILGALGAIEDSGQPNWELAAGYLMLLVMVGAALFFPLVTWLSRKVGKRSLYILALAWLGVILILFGLVGVSSFISPFYQTLALFFLATFPVAIALVIIRPILADVIDQDEKLTGLRREGIYNGMEGLIQKTGGALGPFLAGLFFQFFGNTTQNNLGIRLSAPLAGMCLLAAALAFTRYPIKK